MHVLEAPLELLREGETVVVAGGGSRIERSPQGDRGVLRLGDDTWVLIGGLAATSRALEAPGGRTVTLTGLVATFVSPPGARYVRERLALLLTAPAAPILEAFGPGDGAAPAIPVGWPAPPPRDGPRLLPRLVRGEPPIVARGLDERGDAITVELAAHRIGEDLSVIFIEDTPEHSRRLTLAEADAIEPDPDARLALALANLEALPLVRVGGEGPILSVLRDGEHEAALVLLPSLWAFVDPLLAGPRLVAVPHHGRLWVTGDRAAVPELRRRVARSLEEPGVPVLSPDLHRWDADAREWRLA